MLRTILRSQSKFGALKRSMNVVPMFYVPQRSFNFDITDVAGTFAGTKPQNRKINTKTLCDIIGSRYYPHNEEIVMDESRVVKVFDENDQRLGEMTLREAY